MAAVLPVDPVYRLHELHPLLIVDPKQQILLPLGISHDVCEKDARLVIDEPRLVDALQQFPRRSDECQRDEVGEGR